MSWWRGRGGREREGGQSSTKKPEEVGGDDDDSVLLRMAGELMMPGGHFLFCFSQRRRQTGRVSRPSVEIWSAHGSKKTFPAGEDAAGDGSQPTPRSSQGLPRMAWYTIQRGLLQGLGPRPGHQGQHRECRLASLAGDSCQPNVRRQYGVVKWPYRTSAGGSCCYDSNCYCRRRCCP